ncbi:MAG: hypothetical protein WCE23_03270 [Candidatus Binatus sp.]|uniref:hypothetical protein n=1 Tax=Candidatus Binatus sp. TaxID=2811406 RepID=UPI003C73444E
MRIDSVLTKYSWHEPRGTIVWDSETGEVSGSLADRVLEAARAALERGWISAGAQLQEELPIKNPLHDPTEFGAVIIYLGYELPPELLAEFKLPDFPDPLEGLTEDERRRTVF